MNTTCKPGGAWRKAFESALVSGTAGSLASLIALLACGKLELNDPAAPVNGPSQWLLGKPASYQLGFRLPHTALGYGIHHAMSVFWALMFERLAGNSRKTASAALLPAVATSALACTVDYGCTPQRFTPGFERRLSRKSLFVVYAAFALGLAAGSLLHAQARTDSETRSSRR